MFNLLSLRAWALVIVFGGAAVISQNAGDPRRLLVGVVVVMVGLVLFVLRIIDFVGTGPKAHRWQHTFDEGVTLAIQGNWEGAVEKFELAVHQAGPNPRRLKADEAIAKFLLDRKHRSEAVSYLNDALRVREAMFKPDESGTMGTRDRLAELHIDLDNPAAARQLLEKNISLSRPVPPELRRRLAEALVAEGKTEDAARLYNGAIKEIEHLRGEWHASLADPLLGLAAIHIEAGDFQRARQALQRAHDCSDASGATELTQRARLGMIELLKHQDRYTEAADIASRYLALETSSRQLRPVETIPLLREHAELLTLAGRSEEASKLQRRADLLQATLDRSEQEDAESRARLQEQEVRRKSWRRAWAD